MLFANCFFIKAKKYSFFFPVLWEKGKQQINKELESTNSSYRIHTPFLFAQNPHTPFFLCVGGRRDAGCSMAVCFTVHFLVSRWELTSTEGRDWPDGLTLSPPTMLQLIRGSAGVCDWQVTSARLATVPGQRRPSAPQPDPQLEPRPVCAGPST